MPVTIIATEFVFRWFALLMLIPLSMFGLIIVRVFEEAIFNYNAHTPPFEGDAAEESIPDWAFVMIGSGLIISLATLGYIDPSSIERLQQLLH
jgi:hypothetical protein